MEVPRKLWRVKLHCPHPGCNQKELTVSAGLCSHTHQVLDIDGYYNLASEYLECSNCRQNEGEEADKGFVDDGDDQTVAPVETILAAQQADPGRQLTKYLIN